MAQILATESNSNDNASEGLYNISRKKAVKIQCSWTYFNPKSIAKI